MRRNHVVGLRSAVRPANPRRAPTCAVTKFVERHRLGIVRVLVELDGADHRAIVFERGVDEPATVESVVAERQRPHSGHVDAAFGGAHFVGQAHMGDPCDGVGLVAGKVDAGHLANGATPAIGTDEVRGLQLIPFVGRRDADFRTFRTGFDADHLVAPADVDAEFACPLVEQPDKPRLRHHQHIHRVVANVEQRQRHSAEHPLVRGVRRIV